MERSIRSPIKDSRNLTTECIIGLCIWIKAWIQIFLTSNTIHIQLPFAKRRSFTIAIHTSYCRIAGGHICSSTERDLLALPVNFDGLSLKNVVQVVHRELSNSKEITKDLIEKVMKQNKEFQNYNDNIKKKLNAAKVLSCKTELDNFQFLFDERCNETWNEIGSSNSLNVIPMQ